MRARLVDANNIHLADTAVSVNGEGEPPAEIVRLEVKFFHRGTTAPDNVAVYEKKKPAVAKVA